MNSTPFSTLLRVVRAGRYPILVALATVSSANCGSTDRAGRHATVSRDSAGVRIVESARPMWADADRWLVDSVPLVDIASGGQDSSLVLLRVGGIVPLEDGGVAVVNGSDRQVLVFSADGQLERRVGRRGSGPGDLARPTDALRCGRDSIVVNDISRVSMFEAGGRHVREWLLVPAVADGAVRLAGVAPDCGAFLLYARPERLPSAGETGVAPVTLFWTSAPEQPRDTLGTFEARRVVRRTLGRGGDQGVSVPWTGETRWASAGEFAYVAPGSGAEVKVYDRRGKLRSLFRWQAPQRKIDASDRGLYNSRREAVARLAPGVAQLAPELAEFPDIPAEKPPHLGMIVDDSARVWLRDYPDWIAGRPDLFDRDLPLYNADDEPVIGETWQVFDREGRWFGAVRMPARLTIRAIAGNRVYGVWRDEDGAEHVRIHAISYP